MPQILSITRDPVEALRSLVSMQQRAQHERTGPNAYPQYFVPNILKWVILFYPTFFLKKINKAFDLLWTASLISQWLILTPKLIVMQFLSWWSCLTLRYFVLVHDSYSPVDDAAAAEIFTKIQNAFEPTFCHFLQVLKIFDRPFRTLSLGQL